MKTALRNMLFPAKFAYFIPLSFGFRLLLIASLLWSCTPNQLENPGFQTNESESIPFGWKITNGMAKVFAGPSNENGGVLLETREPAAIELSQTLRLSEGEYFVRAKIATEMIDGSFYLNVDEVNGVAMSGDEVTCLRTLFSFVLTDSKKVKVKFGFTPKSIGRVALDTIFIDKIRYDFPQAATSKKQLAVLNNTFGISFIQNDSLDFYVNKLALSVNQTFLNNSVSPGTDLLTAYSSNVFNKQNTRYLFRFTNDVEDKSAYCQKSSLSLDEIIRLYGIKTRQLHWQRDCSGIHQFLEYYHEKDQKWKIIDPYYGIRYVDRQGEYLGFEEVENLVRHDDFSSKNIEQIEIGKLYYSQQEIMDGWLVLDLAVHINNWQ